MLPSWYETAEAIWLTLVGLVVFGLLIAVMVAAFVKRRQQRDEGRRELSELIHEVATVVEADWVRRVYSALAKIDGTGGGSGGGP